MALREHNPSGIEGASPYPYPVTVEIQGITGPAHFSQLTTALSALREALRPLPLGTNQHHYFDDLFGPSAVQRIGHQLATYGQVRSLVFLGLTCHAIKLYPAGPESSS
ncbi:hypothetical protein OH807_23330 [Kitasatospora sp. NBC_01560]|uniref:hypothetical protein n=1 Tax=Kitasatospora sp. NBC_01560 TaxID=2975965 RepID=UPI00386DA029